jgi:RNA polymerase sigma-70 factor (ECF subfamily)
MSSARAAPLGVGGEDAFRSLVEPYRPALHAHCYRMLGSLHDADDALQNTLLRAWRALPRFEGRSSVRTWLYRIATNECLDAIGRRHRRLVTVDIGPQTGLGDGPKTDGDATPEARYERREALELAFIAALEHLPARQSAVLILRDGLGFSAKEAASSLATTVASVNAALFRARRAVEERLPEPSEQAAMRTLGDRRLRDRVERFAQAFERGEIDSIVALLAEAWRREAGAATTESTHGGGHRADIRLRPIQARRHL